MLFWTNIVSDSDVQKYSVQNWNKRKNRILRNFLIYYFLESPSKFNSLFTGAEFHTIQNKYRWPIVMWKISAGIFIWPNWSDYFDSWKAEYYDIFKYSVGQVYFIELSSKFYSKLFFASLSVNFMLFKTNISERQKFFIKFTFKLSAVIFLWPSIPSISSAIKSDAVFFYISISSIYLWIFQVASRRILRSPAFLRSISLKFLSDPTSPVIASISLLFSLPLSCGFIASGDEVDIINLVYSQCTRDGLSQT